MSNLKKKRALTILVSWLEATRVPHQLKKDDPEVDILIGETPISIDNDAAFALVNGIDSALPVFWSITEKAGVGKPRPIFREQLVGSLLPHQDNDLTAMRHSEFRKVPNNPEVFLREDYQKIVTWAATRFFKFNRVLLKNLGFELNDLKTYAWLYVMNFHGLWRDVYATDKKNGGDLCNYLQQRFFGDFKRLMDRKAKNVLIDTETVAMAMNLDIVAQINVDSGLNRSVVNVASAMTDPHSETLAQEFENLPPSVQMAKLVEFMKTHRSVVLKTEAEEKLLKMKNLSRQAKKEIFRFHRDTLPSMTKEEEASHVQSCEKCKAL